MVEWSTTTILDLIDSGSILVCCRLRGRPRVALEDQPAVMFEVRLPGLPAAPATGWDAVHEALSVDPAEGAVLRAINDTAPVLDSHTKTGEIEPVLEKRHPSVKAFVCKSFALGAWRLAAAFGATWRFGAIRGRSKELEGMLGAE